MQRPETWLGFEPEKQVRGHECFPIRDHWVWLWFYLGLAL